LVLFLSLAIRAAAAGCYTCFASPKAERGLGLLSVPAAAAAVKHAAAAPPSTADVARVVRAY
jgi:hypothetical protein